MPHAIALTFDDGPDPAGTDAVLDALARVEVRATFFVLGERAAQAGAARSLNRMLADGHQVELHGHRHLRHPRTTRVMIERDTEHALRTFEQLGLPRPTRWRVPWGDLAPWTPALAAAHGLDLVGWDLDPEDWAGPDAATMFARLRPGLRAGATILLHDGVGPGALRASCAETAALVAPLVSAIRALGCEPGPLGALLPPTPTVAVA